MEESLLLKLELKTARSLGVGRGFGEAHHALVGFPGAAFFEEFDALEALEDVAFHRDGAGAFEAAML